MIKILGFIYKYCPAIWQKMEPVWQLYVQNGLPDLTFDIITSLHTTRVN